MNESIQTRRSVEGSLVIRAQEFREYLESISAADPPFLHYSEARQLAALVAEMAAALEALERKVRP